MFFGNATAAAVGGFTVVTDYLTDNQCGKR